MATETLSVKITADASKFSSAISKISSDMEGVSNKFEGLNKLGEGFKNVGKTMTLVGAGIVASVGGIVAKGAEWTAQVESTQFLYNNLDKSVQKAIESNSKNAKAIGLTTQQYKNGATSISTYYKNMGLTAEETSKLSGKTMDLVADLGAVADVPFDEALSDFKSALMGNYEAVDKYGISLSASSMQNSEFVKSLGKSWNQLSDNEKMMAAYNEITRQSASAQGLAKQEAESFGMKFKYLQQQISETVGQIGNALLPVLEPLVKKLSETASKISEWVTENPKLTQAILMFVGVLGVLMVTLGPLLMIIGSCITIFTGLATASSVLSIGMLPLIGIIAGVIAAIGLLIGAGVWLCQNWDTVKAKASEVWQGVCNAWDNLKQDTINAYNNIKDAIVNRFNEIKTNVVNKANELKTNVVNKFNELKANVVNKVNEIKTNAVNKFNELKTNTVNKISEMKTNVVNKFNDIKQGIADKINAAKDAVRDAIEKIKGFFNFSWSLPKLKMPHISITGGFSIMPPKAPKFSVDWYSKGAIFKRPTVLGGMGIGDKHNGVGSNAEAILPINKLPQLLGLDKQNNSGNLSLNIENFNNNREQDIKELVEEIAFYLRRKNIAIGG